MTRTLHVTVGYLPQPFATPMDAAAGSDMVTRLITRERTHADATTTTDDAVAVISPAATALFGGNFGGDF